MTCMSSDNESNTALKKKVGIGSRERGGFQEGTFYPCLKSMGRDWRGLETAGESTLT